jgi:hypothetical protein
VLGENADAKPHLELLQQKTDDYIARLWEWHGTPGSHRDEPSSFGRAVEEVKAGKVEHFNDVRYRRMAWRMPEGQIISKVFRLT